VNKGPNRPPSEEKEWQYRSIFDAANDGLIINDLETGLVVEANPAACVMHGYTQEEFIGLPLRGLPPVGTYPPVGGLSSTRTLPASGLTRSV
jgi:PAS domain-containing protein